MFFDRQISWTAGHDDDRYTFQIYFAPCLQGVSKKFTVSKGLLMQRAFNFFNKIL